MNHCDSSESASVPGPQPLTRDAAFKPPRAALVILLVAVLAVLPYVSALAGGYLWDDTHLIQNNPRVHSLGQAKHYFTHSFFDTVPGTSPSFVTYFRPLVHFSYAIDWQLGAGNPTVFHATNLLQYMLLAGLVTAYILRWGAPTLGAAGAALLFAWHPTKAESVAWISGRTDLMVAIFIFLALWARSAHSRAPRIARSAEALATLCAYGSKETAVLLPMFALVEAWLSAGRPPITSKVIRQLLASTWGQWLFAAGYLALRSRLFAIVEWPTADRQHFASRVGLALETLGRAMQLMIFPHSQSAEHGLIRFDPQNQTVLDWRWQLFGILALLLLTVIALRSRQSRPGLTVAIVIGVSSLLPTANLLPTHLQAVVYERFVFLPTLGLALAWVELVKAAPRVPWRSYCSGTLTALITLCFAWKANARTSDYVEPTRFWQHEAQVNPLSTTAAQGMVEQLRFASDVQPALRYLELCHRNASVRRQTYVAMRCAYDAVALIAARASDLDEATLSRCAAFFQDVAAPHPPPIVQFHSPRFTLALRLADATTRRQVQAMRSESLAYLSMIQLRTRHWGEALSATDRALSDCSECRHVLPLAKVLAIAGQNSRALALIARFQQQGPSAETDDIQGQIQAFTHWRDRADHSSGPAQLHAEAQAYLSVGLYGAAYSVLKPHLLEFAGVTSANREFANIAYFAGDEDLARRVLLQHNSPHDVDQLIASWRPN